MEINNKRLKAAHSHFLSCRDRYVAELEVMLNSYSGTFNMDAMIETFEKLAVANMAINNINSILADNSNADEPNYGINLDQIDEMNRMVEAIKQKMGSDRTESENNNSNKDA